MPDPHAPVDPPVHFIVIGAMKCGTTSLHHYLSRHPSLALAPEKEVNFFFGERPGGAGQLWRGTEWYSARFPADGRLRGDVSPGYTSPDHGEVAARIADVAPDAKLLYLVRDPLERAVSQYRHHRREGSERRAMPDALLDPASHYVLRSRYADRLRPFLERFRRDQLAIVDHQDLSRATAATVASICRFLGVAPDGRSEVFERRLNAAPSHPPPVPDEVVAGFEALVRDDVVAFAGLRAALHRCAPDSG